MIDLQALLEECASQHSHLCPRQVLGVRMALAGASSLGMNIPRKDKSLLIIAETDGCFVDGLITPTHCTVGHRTLRIVDYGKVAATFINTKTGDAIRIAPCNDVREKAYKYCPEEHRRYFAQLRAYQIMPDDELFTTQKVTLTQQIKDIIGRPGIRVNCVICGEEIINQREILINDLPYCLACSGNAYYKTDYTLTKTNQQSYIEPLNIKLSL